MLEPRRAEPQARSTAAPTPGRDSQRQPFCQLFSNEVVVAPLIRTSSFEVVVAPIIRTGSFPGIAELIREMFRFSTETENALSGHCDKCLSITVLVISVAGKRV